MPIAPALKNYLTLELSRSPNGFCLPLLDPDGRLASETTTRRLPKTEVKRLLRNRTRSETVKKL
jgi:hypothetical protein